MEKDSKANAYSPKFTSKKSESSHSSKQWNKCAYKNSILWFLDPNTARVLHPPREGSYRQCSAVRIACATILRRLDKRTRNHAKYRHPEKCARPQPHTKSILIHRSRFISPFRTKKCLPEIRLHALISSTNCET